MNLFNGSNGKISATRFCAVMVVLTIMAVFFGHNLATMIRGTNEFVSLGMNEVLVISGVLGFKVAQHFSETKRDATTKV